MRAHVSRPAPQLPSADKRWKIVNAAMRRHGYAPDALIETLHTVQEAFGYVDSQALKFIASALNVPLSKTYGVATFSPYFVLKPGGAHTCVLCTGTACWVKGGAATMDAIKETYGVEAGQTTADGKVSLLGARCLGSCGLAPAGVFDGEMVEKLTPKEAIKRIEEWTAA